ncbi:MAG: hypothetical protein E7329_08920 [Clostridiales bacterium]|nr:hypothetical protein [Clostridiales bacterium]
MKLTPPSLDRASAPNFLSALVMAVIVVLLFTPFWHFGEGEAAQAVSINSYVWFPSDNTQVESYFQEALGEKPEINSVIVMPILLLIFGAIGTVLCILKADQPFVAVFPASVGVAGIWGFATVPALRLGSTWGIMLALCIALVGLAVWCVAQAISMWKHG